MQADRTSLVEGVAQPVRRSASARVVGQSARSLGKLHAGVYVFVEDVDAHCDRARAAGAKVMLPPADQPWGDRMYCAADHEGQFWMFARRLVSR